MAFTTKIFRKIEEIPSNDWNQIYPRVLEGYQFFKSLDESAMGQFSFYYLLVYEGSALVGAATCFLMNYSLDTTLQGPLKNLATTVKKIFPGIFNLKALMCGQPIGQGRMGVAVGYEQAVVKAVYNCIQQIAQSQKVAILVFKEFGASYSAALACLEKEGFYKFESMPNTEKEIHFSSFDEYLMTLSYKTRYDLKRKFKKVDGQVKIDLEITHDLGDALGEAHGLYMQMVSRHEVGLEVMPEKFFECIAKNMPDQTLFFLWRMEERLVAFAFCLVSGGHFLDYYLGLDYSTAYQYHLYFVRFRDMLKWCIEHKIKTYEMGSTNYDPKKRLGFRFIPLYIYAKFRNRQLNPFLKIFCEFIKPERHDPVLRDMKKKELKR